jgi:hypothetical protein
MESIQVISDPLQDAKQILTLFLKSGNEDLNRFAFDDCHLQEGLTGLERVFARMGETRRHIAAGHD